ncbi:MAG: ABC transporter ATP-binding protein [Chloroflexota bacterium]|nr:ABC transporter ATP-binding protein [Chloroflexota bacterium]
MACRYKVRLIFAYVAFASAIGFALLIPKIFGNSIDALVVVKDGVVEPLQVGIWGVGGLLFMAALLLGASLMRGFSDFGRTYATDSLSQKVSYDIRNLLYDKLQHISFAFHDKEHTGNLMSKATSDVESVRRFINLGLIRSLDVIVRLVAIVGILMFLNWKLALLSLIFVPFVIMRSAFVLRRLRRMWLHVQEIMGETVTVLQENLVGVHVVKAFASEDYEIRKYSRKAQELREEYFKTERLQGINSAWMTFYFTVALGVVLWFGGWEVVRGNLTAGGLAQFVLYMNQLTFPIRQAAQVINSFSRAISSGQRIFEVLDASSPVEERHDAKVLTRSEGQVKLDNVSFSYDDRIPALNDININASQGQITAILGSPGSGKSTIVNLLPRFYDVTSGSITIDDEDIREFTLESLRRNVGIVQQDVFLFSATIGDNIAYGVANATEEDVVNAAKIAQLHDHIMSLPEGYNTWVGERGSTLSGGQRQRLSIARTVLINPPVLILDDSTSSVDVETERLIHRAMINVMRGRTTFVIAHRLSTVRDANLIVVLKDGEIAEQGNHDELFALNGIYRDIYDLQLRPQEELLLDAVVASTESQGGN